MPTQIIIEPDTRFTCEPCGFCCGIWDIHIDKQRKDSLLQLEWVQKLARDLEASQHQSLFKIVDQNEHSLLQRQHGTCSFLNPRMLCSIHASEGYDAKPIICQQYPNIYYETPRGVEVFLDYSCPEVIRNHGEFVTPETIRQGMPRHYVQTVRLAFPLNSQVTLNWEGYLQLEEVFLRVLATSGAYDEKILCLDQITRQLAGRLAGVSALTGDSVKDALCAICSNKFDDILSKVQRLPSNRSKRDLYVAILIHWVEATFSGEIDGKPMTSARVVKNILKQWKGIGENSFAVFKFQVDYGRIKTVDFSAESPDLRDLVNRYLRYLVRTLVGTGEVPITKRIVIIATNFALTIWFSKAHAASNGRTRVTCEDVVFGIKVVEKLFSYRLFNRLAGQRTFLSNYINLLFENPTLPSTMLSRG
jgi:Fe-S-cluster containining protein